MALLSPDEIKFRLSPNRHSLIHFNARSLKKNLDAIDSFINTLNHSFSFICMSETWLSESESNMYSFPSYQTEYCHRTSDSHGGTAVFISPNISYTRRHDLSFTTNLCESVWIETDRSFLPHGRNFVLGCIYRSPSSSITDFLLNLDTILCQLSLENKDVLLVGDININLLDTESSLYAAYTDCFSGFGFESLIHAPTRCTHNGPGTLIDHLLSNLSPQPFSAVIETDITDHFPVLLIFDADATRVRNTRVTSVFDQVRIKEAIGVTDWSLLIR